jgi:hypothetical protein
VGGRVGCRSEQKSRYDMDRYSAGGNFIEKLMTYQEISPAG